MLLTILSDQYRAKESAEISAALSDLCSPNDNYGWSSAGLYCYWNPANSEILYIGLSVDLGRRFSQHNGLENFDSTGTKREEITNFFKSNEKLGFSVFLQSSLDQPNLSVAAKERLQLPGFEGIINMRNGEGTLLQAYRDMTGKFPTWNKMGGAKSGAKHASNGHFNFFKDLSEMQHTSVMRSELSLRTLSDDDNAHEANLEIALHGLRIRTIGGMGMPIDALLDTYLKLGLEDDIKMVTESKRGSAWIQRMRDFQKNQR